jgi:predicted nucleic acid-binding protein
MAGFTTSGGICRAHSAPFDTEVSGRWGRMTAHARKSGFTIAAIDAMIAATALHHNLVVVTLNGRDFEKCGVPYLDPSV